MTVRIPIRRRSEIACLRRDIRRLKRKLRYHQRHERAQRADIEHRITAIVEDDKQQSTWV